MSEFTDFLKRVQRQVNLRFGAQVLINSIVLFAMGVHLFFLLWLALSPTSPALLYANIGIKAFLSLVIIYLVWSGYKSFWGMLQVARFLDRQQEHHDDLFQNTLEIAGKEQGELVAAALAEQANQRRKQHRYRIPALFPSWMVFCILFLAVGMGSVWAMDWANFQVAFRQFYTNEKQQINYKRTIDISPGNKTIGRHTPVEIKLIEPDLRLKHRLFFRTDKQWRELGFSSGSYIFSSLDSSIEYYVENDVCKSAVFRIEVLDEPIVKKWWVQYNPPAYTGVSTWVDTLGYGNIETWKHSTVKLSIQSNIPLVSAQMVFANASRIDLQRLDESSYITQLKINEPGTWYLELTDALGRKSRPEEKTIKILNDNPPGIRISFPGEDTVLNQDLLLPLIIEADDDFGLRNCSLKYQVQDREVQTLIVQEIISGKVLRSDYLLDLKNANLFPGDVVTYWAEVYDNSPEAQKAESARYKARFPSIEEIYREIENQQQNKQSELESALDKSKDLKQEFEEKRRELLKQDNPKWEDKKQLEKILNDQEKLSDQVQKVADNYQNLIEKMHANEALSSETLQKMQKIQELMQEINSKELQDAMSKFENALKNLNPQDLKKAMENFKFSMEDFAKKIEQTLNLLESIKKEQAVQKALQMSQETEKMQQNLKEKSGDRKQDSEALAKEQEQVKESFENLQQELENLDEMLSGPQDKQSKQQLDELQQDMKQSQAQQNMQDAQQQLQSNQRSQAQQSQEEALQKMRRFTMKLGQMKNSMGSGNQQRTMMAVQTAMRELLIFSQKHEDTAAKYRNDPYVVAPELIAQYEGIQLVLNKLFSETQVLMMIPPKFFTDLNSANQAYRDVFSAIGEQIPNLRGNMDNIQKGINLMVYDLMQAMQNSSSGGGGGGGMQSLMQMLEQMSQEQMAMNMLTEQLMMQMQEQGGNMDAAMQQQIQKLANDQQRLAENLKRALQNNPNAQKQGSSLQQIADEMDSISRQLKNNQISPDLLERQERIVSKMLDAQRSINKREFTEKRKGETAPHDIRQADNKTLDYNALRKNSLLEDSYRSYPREYQQVILEYLKQLNAQAGN